MKTMQWKLANFPENTKEKIQELAKKDGINANEKVAEILNDYLYDIELGQNKNYFDRRYQEIIDGYGRLVEAQNENTEAFGESFNVLVESQRSLIEQQKNMILEIQRQQEFIMGLHGQVEFMRASLQLMLDYSVVAMDEDDEKDWT